MRIKSSLCTNNFGSAHEFIVEGQDGQICSLTVMADVIDNIIRTQRRFNILASLKIIGHASELDVETNKSATLKYGYGLVLLPKQMTSFSTE